MKQAFMQRAQGLASHLAPHFKSRWAMFSYFMGFNALDTLLTGLAIVLGVIKLSPVLPAVGLRLGLPPSIFELQNMMLLKTAGVLVIGVVIWQFKREGHLEKVNLMMLATVAKAMAIVYALVRW